MRGFGAGGWKLAAKGMLVVVERVMVVAAGGILLERVMVVVGGMLMVFRECQVLGNRWVGDIG